MWSSFFKFLLSVFTLMVFLHSSKLFAQYDFTPIKPGSCQFGRIATFDYKSYELPTNPVCPPDEYGYCKASMPDRNYINQLNHVRHVVANAYINQIDFWVMNPDLELWRDYLEIREDKPGGIYDRVTGSFKGRLMVLPLAQSQSFQSLPPKMTFYTNETNTATGFQIDTVNVCSTLEKMDENIATMKPMELYEGILLDSSDVVFLKIPRNPPWPEDKKKPEKPLHYTVTLQSDRTTDIDLFLKCGKKPTAADYTRRSIGYTGQEFIHIDPSICDAQSESGDKDLYVAVHSFKGETSFRLVWSFHLESSHKTIHAGFRNFPGDVAPARDYDYNHAGITAQIAARRFYGATEGGINIGDIHIYREGGCTGPQACGGHTCNICFDSQNGFVTSDMIYVEPAIVNPSILAHEMGHYYFLLMDEYSGLPTSNAQCGHSIMALTAPDPGITNNFCSDFDHKYDANPAMPLSFVPSAWSEIIRRGILPYGPESPTPDNNSYESFPFKETSEIWPSKISIPVGNLIWH